MKTTLIIFFLGIQSSYSDNREERVEGFGDTVQWLIAEDQVWRVRTYALDEDVHVYLVASKRDLAVDYVALAHSNTEKHYGDVLEREVTLYSNDGTSGIEAGLTENGLDAHLNKAPSGLFFWSPIGTKYSAKSQP
jgi:hypothetical protein